MTTFAFEWDLQYRFAALPFGITTGNARVEVTPSEFVVRYGLWTLKSALTNIVGTEESGGYAFVKTAGPPHLSLADHGISFATNGRKGLCIQFREPVAGIDPTGRIKHPAATVTVADIEGLARALDPAV
jgi:hypothetical protein